MRRMRVLIIDDHEEVRAALYTTLSSDREMHVVSTAATRGGDLEEALRSGPDVVLLDVKRRDGNGLDICRRIIRERPSTRVFILTSYPDDREKAEVQAMGASGYLLKDLDVHALLSDIKDPRARTDPWGTDRSLGGGRNRRF